MPDGPLPTNLLPPDPNAATPGGGATPPSLPTAPSSAAPGTDAGVDHTQRASDYVSRVMHLEGSGKDPRSSAVGGFIDSTWLNLMHQTVPQSRQMPDDQVLAYRSDPVLRARMVAAYAADNAPLLKMAGIEPDETNLRLAHWFGPAGAVRVLHADPSTPMDRIFSQDVIAANPILKGKTAGDLVSFTNQQMTGATLQQHWGHLSPDVQGLIGDIQARGQQAHAENMAMIQAYEQEAAKAPAGSAERQQAIDDMRRVSHKMMSDWEKLSSHPPIQKPMDIWQQLGSMSTIIAALGGLFARNHMTAGLAAAGEAIRAINTNNYEQFQQSYKRWHDQTDMGLKMISLQNQEITELMSDEHLSQSEKQARLQTLATEQGMLWKDQAGQAGSEEKILGYVAATERAAASAKNMQQMIGLQVYGTTLSSLRQGYMAQHKGAQPPPDIEAQFEQQAIQAMKGQTVNTPAPVTVPDDWSGKPNTPPPGSNIDAGIWSAAIAYVKSGGTIKPPFSLWGKNPMAVQFNQAIPAAQKALGVTPTQMTDLNIKFAADKGRQAALSKAVANPVTQRNILSLNTVADHLTLLRDYSDALNNGEVQRANQLLNRIAVETGHPEVNNYKLAATITGDEIVRLLTVTGGTSEDRRDVQQMFSTISSPEQLKGAIDTASNFVRARFEPLEQQYLQGAATNEERAQRRQDFVDTVLTPEARALWESGGGHDNATGATQSMPVPSAFAHDPDGTGYKRNGQTWVKRGGQLVLTPGAVETPR